MGLNDQVTSPGTRRILVVYDEPTTRGLVAKALGRAHHVVETSDPQSAFGVLAASGHYFDLVIVSCLARNRPRHVAGLEFARSIFAHLPWLPVVLISWASEMPRLAANSLLTGVRAILRKPFSVGDLVGVVRRLTRRPRKRPRPSPAVVEKIKRVLTFLGGPRENPATLGELATTAAMSRSHFSHTFHTVAGMALRDYVRDLRLQHAHRLILNSPLSLTDVAIDSGFYDLPHLDKAFRQRIGVSPQEYRSRYRSDQNDKTARGGTSIDATRGGCRGERQAMALARRRIRPERSPIALTKP
jgi:AraC-like DNA-binding protein